MKNIAVILAGGVGNRLNANKPKQFIKVAGKTIIEHTISIFQSNINIDEIAIVCNPTYLSNIDEILAKNSFNKVKKILSGGEERYTSSLSAINSYKDSSECNLIFHDAVRPLVNDRIINDVIRSLIDYSAVDVAIPATDTIINVDSLDDCISEIPDRTGLKQGQTPQAFRLSVIKAAFNLAMQDSNFKTTDDCGVVHKYMPNVKIKTVIGEVFNMKLTFQEDVFLLDKLFQLRSGNFDDFKLEGNDSKKLKNKVIVIFGGSYGIGFDIKEICEENNSKVYCFSRSLNSVDVQDENSVRECLKTVYDKEGKIDYVVNTAAILNKEPLINMSYTDIKNAINVNYLGMVNVAKESFKYLKDSLGHLLLFTSSSYTRGRMNYSIYSSTKCATVNFVQAIAEEWDGYGVRVNCINPERTKTPMREKNFGLEPENTLLNSKDVANVSIKVLNSNFNGQVIDVKIHKK